MADEIMMTDVKLKYVSIAEARGMSGLRLVLGAYPIPGPWREACKGLFHVKGIPHVPVVTASAGRSDLEFGMADADGELKAWSGQSSAPVAIWNDERPRSSWIDQLYLAERINPEPPLIPTDTDARVRMMGLCHEVCGENGFAWNKRLAIIHATLPTLAPGDPAKVFWQHVGEKYGYSPDAGRRAPGRMAEILTALDTQLAGQQAAGHRYFMGASLSALDIYWATFCALLAPLPPEQCPMATSFRGVYSNPDEVVQAALSPRLLAHRDFVYQTHLELPVVF